MSKEGSNVARGGDVVHRGCKFIRNGLASDIQILIFQFVRELLMIKMLNMVSQIPVWSSKLDAGELYSDFYGHSCKFVRQIRFGEQSSGSKDAGYNVFSHSYLRY